MTLTEKAAYIKGLAEGLSLDGTKPETKIINELLSLVEDMARSIADVEEDVEYLNDYIEEIDEDLGALEEDVYDCDCEDDYDECDGCCGCDSDFDDDDFDCEECFEIECPSCGEKVCFDSTIEPEDLVCPACQEKING
ncbi:MAG: hypothetical protein E7671_06070 [Ruminococcaceae bacterium]|nr:hypothetical protein [Oscillospiraceae bacterium]